MGAVMTAATPATPGAFCASPAVRKKGGILKRKAAEGPRICRRAACPRRLRRSGPRVAFSPKVRLEVYSRVLDGGDTVPGDGCMVSLGLGRRLRSLLAPLAGPPAAGRPGVEENAYVTGTRRERLLRHSMGEVRYLKAWLRHRREVQQTLRSRREANQDGKDQQFMLSPPEAQAAARQLREEALAISAEVRAATAAAAAASPRKPKCKVTFVDTEKSSKFHIISKAAVVKPERRTRSPTPGRGRRTHPRIVDTADPSIPACHRCSRHIATGPLEKRCSCLGQIQPIESPVPEMAVAAPLIRLEA